MNLKNSITLDQRSLNLFRIGLGLFIIFDLIFRSCDLGSLYTGLGVYPPGFANKYAGPFGWSFYFLNDSLAFAILLFVLQGITAIALIIGWKSKLFLALSLIFTISLHAANPLILGGGDDLIRLLMFWALFLPIGPKVSEEKKVASPASAGIILQLLLVYWSALILRAGAPEWWGNFNALYYMLSLDELVTPIGKYLLNFPSLLKAGTLFFHLFEIFGTFLILSPIATGKIRMILVPIFIFFHLVLIQMTLYAGVFPYAITIAWLIMLPAEFWQTAFGKKIEKQIFKKGKTPKPSKFLFYLPVFFMVWAIGLNAIPNLQGPIKLAANSIGLWQKWRLFAPTVLKTDGWFIIEGNLKGEKEVNLYGKKPIPLTFEKPENLKLTHPSMRWLKYMRETFIKKNFPYLKDRLLDFYCQKYNAGPKNIEKTDFATLIFMWEQTPPPGSPTKVIRRDLWSRSCPK